MVIFASLRGHLNTYGLPGIKTVIPTIVTEALKQ
jgi:hypothetical protein